MEGNVVDIKLDKGYCWIMGSDQRKYFFHHTAAKFDWDARIKAGMRVSFDSSDMDRGPRAANVMIVS